MFHSAIDPCPPASTPLTGARWRPVTGTYVGWKWEEWAERIDSNFEKLFYIHHVPHPEFEPVPELINVRGMYKDSHCASQFWADYQLRCNFPIAMVAVSAAAARAAGWCPDCGLQRLPFRSPALYFIQCLTKSRNIY